MTGFIERLHEVIEPQVNALGLSVVRVKVFGGRRQTLQVMIERADGSDVNVEECADASRAISPVLDVFDPLDGAYSLEVSSPGIDRPLTRQADFERFSGFLTKVELEAPVDGRKRFRGVLLGLKDQRYIEMNVDGSKVSLPLAAVQSAKLVLTDDLIAAHQDQSARERAAV